MPSLGEEEWQALREPLQSGWLTQGPKVREFEDRFAETHQAKHAIATTSCTTALHLMLAAADIGPDDEVIVPSFTWVSTANAVLYLGATLVFADVNLDTFNIDASDVAAKVTAKTKAVIAVHLFGLCADTPQIKGAIPESVILFEDAACAAGATLSGESAGSLGHAAAFSFHPRKSMTTGEGGMVTTNDETLAKRARVMRNHGADVSEEERHVGPKPYLMPEFSELGFNYRMSDLQAALGLVQLSKLARFIKEREEIALTYDAELRDIDWLVLPQLPSSGQHAWQAYVCRVTAPDAKQTRNQVMEQLLVDGVSTRPGTHAIHSLDYYARTFNLTDADLPNSATCRDSTIALPLHNNMTESDVARVVDAVKKFR